MKKEFNITGNCNAEEHYMMDNTEKLRQVFELVEYRKYFSINRPRQYGKTTTLDSIANILREKPDYLPIELNLQGVDSMWHESDKAFAEMFLDKIILYLKYPFPQIAAFAKEEKSSIISMDKLSVFIKY